MSILDMVRGKKEDPEVIARAVVETENRLSDLQKQLQEATQVLLEREQAGLLGGSVASGEIDALEKKRDRISRQVEALKDAISKLRMALEQAVDDMRRSLDGEKINLTAALSRHSEKLNDEAFDLYVDLAVIVMAKNGGYFDASGFRGCPFFDQLGPGSLEIKAKERLSSLSKGPLVENLKMVRRVSEIDSLVNTHLWNSPNETIDERYVRLAREKMSVREQQ